MIDSRKCCTLPWSWAPSTYWHFDNSYIKAFSLLHPLDIGLKSPSKPLDQLVPWNIICWLSNEQFWPIIILIRRWLNHLDILSEPGFTELSLVQLFYCRFEVGFRVWRWLEVEV